MLRGVCGQKLFSDDFDRFRLCWFLQEASEKHGLNIHAFCFMSNHLHFILEPTASPLPECVHAFAFRYAQYFNRKYEKQGHVFQGRFRSIIVEGEVYLKRLLRYIHLNPVEAGLKEYPVDYRWSSHRSYMNMDSFVWLTKQRILSAFDACENDAIEQLSEFIHRKIEAKDDIERIHRAFDQGAFGSEDFVREFGISTNYDEDEAISFDHALSYVCQQFQINMDDLLGLSREKNIVNARSVLSLFVSDMTGWTSRDLAKFLGRNPGTISRLAVRAAKQPELVAHVRELRESYATSGPGPDVA